MNTEIRITFPDVTESDANKLALQLKQYLLSSELIESKIVNESIDTMDFGSTLAIVLGSGSLISIAKGISNWLSLKQNKKITIKWSHGQIIGERLTSKDVEKIVDRFSENLE